jgi:hypothetical protein
MVYLPSIEFACNSSNDLKNSSISSKLFKDKIIIKLIMWLYIYTINK